MGPGTLIRRAGLFGLLVLSVLACFYCFGPSVSPVDYLGAARQKQGRLKQLGSPKVVVIGGSNAAFGIDGAALEQGLCKPAVNMGLHAALGFRYMTAEVVDQLGSGDVVIVALEYSNFEKPDRMEDVLSVTIDRVPGALAFVPWWHKPQVVFELAVWRMQAAWNVLVHDADPFVQSLVYNMHAFDEHGDMVAHLLQPIPIERKNEPEEFDTLFVDERFWPMAMEFNERAKAAGAMALFSWPSVARSMYRAADCEAVEQAMRTHGLTVVGSPADYAFPDSMFFDTWYHLHTEGRAHRTSILLRDICRTEPALCCAGADTTQ